MDESWGLGYGEESDLHLRARAQGFLGALVGDAYVYHFGGGTFRHEKTCHDLRRKNHARFMELWGDAFDLYSRLAEVNNPIQSLSKQLESAQKAANRTCDVLFVLPCLIRGIGGVHVTLDLCNHLIMRGIDARVVVVGPIEKGALEEYSEPLYVNPWHAKDVHDFLNKFDAVPSIVVTTLYSTVPSAWSFAQRCGARLINFVQGFEVYFDGGKPYEEVRNSYFLAETSITTSSWLTEKVKSKAPGCDVLQLPLGINRYVFYPPQVRKFRGGRKLRVGVVLRASVDKGQFVLRELVDLLFQREADFSLTVFKPDDYPLTPPDSQLPELSLVPLPVSRVKIAEALREVDVFVDASLHEGYGLFPLEAMACGACVLVSDSGGVSQYLRHGVNGRMVVAVNKPEAYLEQLLELHRDRDELERLREAAVETVAEYDEEACFDRYYEFFSGSLKQAAIGSDKAGACQVPKEAGPGRKTA
jgi:glycosyltransferase involved in cell wall biosynthesis